MPCVNHLLTLLSSSFFILLVILCPFAKGSIEVTNFHIPNVTYEGDSIIISCAYKLRGSTLYSHKWYKDGLEFWRYEPRGRPQTLFLQVPGVKTLKSKSNRTHLVLTDLTLNSTGQYTCELSAEADYTTKIEEGVLTVLPRPRASSSAATVSAKKSFKVNTLLAAFVVLIASVKHLNGDHFT